MAYSQPEVAQAPAPPPPPSVLEAAPAPPPSRFLRALNKTEPEAAPKPAPPPSRFLKALQVQEAAQVPEVAKASSSQAKASSGSHSPEKGKKSSSSAPKRSPEKIAPPEPLVQTLLDSMQDCNACLAACTALEAATARSSALHRKVLASGGVEALVAAMTAHRGIAEIQLAACHALQHLAASAACKAAAKVAEAGGCAAMLLAMGPAHAENPLVTQAAAHALELVAFGGPVPRERAVNDGAIEVLVSALKNHRSTDEVQQAVLAALQTVIERNPDCQQIERLAAADGIQRIVTTLGEHKSAKHVQYWGRLLLHDICTENRDLRSETLRKLHYQGVELDLA